MKNNTLARASEDTLSRPTADKLVESLVTRGDLSGLTPTEKANHYVTRCKQLGLDPASKPFAVLKLNGKEILYAEKGAADQLAKIHRVNRKITDGPKVIDLAGTKLVFVQCEASTPDGRSEVEVATVPLTDPVNVLMKAVTKVKRRATLSILGLGMLDEMELETIPPSKMAACEDVNLALASEQPETTEETSDAQLPEGTEDYYEAVAGIELPGEAVAVWMKHRNELGPLNPADREAAWRALCKRVEVVGKMANAKVWLKKAIAEEDARRGPQDDGPRGGGKPTPQPGTSTTAVGDGHAARGTDGSATALVAVPSWAETPATIRAHAASWGAMTHAENSTRLHGRAVPAMVPVVSSWLQARGYDEDTADARAAQWAHEGPKARKRRAA